MTSTQVRAFAKVNLYLKILSKRQDGFHEIETVMQNISLFDLLSIEKTDEGISVECDDSAVPSGQANICFKAVERLMPFSGRRGVRITIHKNIPSGAGLGGGSSDAAAVINALNNIWELSLDDNALMKIAAETGSDVPFFMLGGRALCTGRGEKVKKLPDMPETHLVLIKPSESVPTKWAYEEYDRSSAAGGYACFGSKSGGMFCSEKPRMSYENDFEKAILPKYRGINDARTSLLSAGAVSALMTGSGSAVFGIARGKEHAESILSKVKILHPLSYLVRTVDRSFEIV
jgi:4-diphosphocytidyl-2-C-methyl-D-erythritol kinase